MMMSIYRNSDLRRSIKIQNIDSRFIDSRFFEELVLRNLDFIYDCAFRRTCNSLNLEKNVQRTIETACTNFSSFDQEGDFLDWRDYA